MKTKVDFHSMIRELYPYPEAYTYRELIVQACKSKWKALEPEDLPKVLALEQKEMEWHEVYTGTTRDVADVLIRCAAKQYLESVSI